MFVWLDVKGEGIEIYTSSISDSVYYIECFAGMKKGKPNLTITTRYALRSSITWIHELNESMNVYIATL